MPDVVVNQPRLTLRQWEDAKRGAWLGANVTLKTDFTDKKLITNLKICFEAGTGVKSMVPVLI